MSKSIFNSSIATLLLLSLLLPTVWQPIKLLILGICLFSAILLLIQENCSISRNAIILMLLYATTGLAWSLYGVFLGNPGSHLVMTVMVAYPLILPLLAFCYDDRDANKIHKVLIGVSISVAIFDLGFVFSSLFMPDNTFSKYVLELYKDDAVIDDAATYFKFTIPNISSCIFLLPYLIASFIHSNKHRTVTGATIILMIIIVILSGRRALFITPILGICAAYALTIFSHKEKQILNPIKNLKILLVGLIFAAFIFIEFQSYYGAEYYIGQIKSIFDFSGNESNYERKAQFNSLLQDFYKSPLFGAGAGAAASYSRSDTQPWAYELAYVAFIFQYGLLGFIIYATGILLLISTLVRTTRVHGRDNFEFFFLAGFITFLIANSTNPYLAKFDYMWIIFIPFALLNKAFLAKAKTKKCKSMDRTNELQLS